MSVSVSSNVSKIQTTVTEDISNTTNPTLVSNNGVQATFTAKNNCTFTVEAGGTFDSSVVSAQTQNVQQLSKVASQSSLNADVMTALAQNSTASGSGLLSLGFAGAFNSATSLCTAGASISSAVSDAITSTNSTSSSITCADSAVVTIAGNWNASVGATQSLVTSQYIENSQISDISNSVSQSITQTATATMEAISTGALIVIGVVVLLLVFGKPIIDAINRGKSAAGTASTASTASSSAAAAASTGSSSSAAAASTGSSSSSASTGLNWYGALLSLGGAVAMATGAIARQTSDPCNSSDQCTTSDSDTSTCSCTDHYTCGVTEDHNDVAIPVSSPPQMFLFSIYEENAAMLYNASLRRMAVRTFATFNSSSPLMSNSGFNCGVYVAIKKFCMTSVVPTASATIPQRAMGGLIRYFQRIVQNGGLVTSTDFGDDTDWNGLPDGACPSALVDVLNPLVPFHLHNKFLPPAICGNKAANTVTNCSISTLTDFQDSTVDDASIAVKGAAAAVVDTGPTLNQIFGLERRASEPLVIPIPTSLVQLKNIVGAAPNIIRPMCYRDIFSDAGVITQTQFYQRNDPNGSCPSGFNPMWMGPSARHINLAGRGLATFKQDNGFRGTTYIGARPFGANNTDPTKTVIVDENGCTASGVNYNITYGALEVDDLRSEQQWYQPAVFQAESDNVMKDAIKLFTGETVDDYYLNAIQCKEGSTTNPATCSGFTGILDQLFESPTDGMHFGFTSSQVRAAGTSYSDTSAKGTGLANSTVVCQQIQAGDTTNTVFYAQLPSNLTPPDSGYSSQQHETGMGVTMGLSFDQQYCAEAMGLLRSPADNVFDENNNTSLTNPAQPWTSGTVKDPNTAGAVKHGLIKPVRMSFPNSKYWDTAAVYANKKPYEFIPSILIGAGANLNIKLSEIGAMLPEGDVSDDGTTSRTTVLTDADIAYAKWVEDKVALYGVGSIANCNFAVQPNGNVRSCDGTVGIMNCWTQVLCEANGGVWEVDSSGYGSCKNLLADDCSAACGNCKTASACAGQLESQNCQWIEGDQAYCAQGCSAAANICLSCSTAECTGNQLCQTVTWTGATTGKTRTACASSHGSCGLDKADDGGGCIDPTTNALVPALNFDWIVMRLPTPFLSGTYASAVTDMSACLPIVFTPSPDGAPFSYDDGSCTSGAECVPTVGSDGKTITDCASAATQEKGSQSAVASATSIVGTCGYAYEESVTDSNGNVSVIKRSGCYDSASAPCACVDAAAAAAAGVQVDDAFRSRRYAQGRRIPNKVSPYCYFLQKDTSTLSADAIEKSYNFVAIENPNQEKWVWAQNGDTVRLCKWYFLNRIFNSILLFNSDPTHFSVLGLSTFMNAGGLDDAGQPVYPLTETGLTALRQLSATSPTADAETWVMYQTQPLLVQDALGEYNFFTLQEIDAQDAVTKGLMLSQLQNFVYSKAGQYMSVTPTSLARLGLGIINNSSSFDPVGAQNALAAYSGTVFGAMGICRTPYNSDALVYGGLVGGGVALAVGAALLVAGAAV